nr:unnamed protein product [Callosobruchus analis]
MKLKMLNWDFCVGLLIGPPSVTSKMRGSAVQNELINSSLDDLRPLLLSRKEASLQLAHDESECESTGTLPPKVAKRSSGSRPDVLQRNHDEMKSMLASILNKLNSTQKEDDNSSLLELSEDEEDIPTSPFLLADDESETSWMAPGFSRSEDTNVYFLPKTKEQEPAIPGAKPHIAEQGVQCQRLDQLSYNKVRYAEVQKKLQAAPVFSALKVSTQLSRFPHISAQEHLVKFDTVLGTIIHGLLLQREAFAEALGALTAEHPSIKANIQENILADNTKFRSLSDDLLQYACGLRAEVIEQRRSHFRSRDNIVGSLLDSIPHKLHTYSRKIPLQSFSNNMGAFFSQGQLLSIK